MNTDREDKQLHKLIHELRKEDEARTPDFSKIWRKAASESMGRHAVRHQLLTRFAVAAIVVILIGGSIFLLDHDLSIRKPQDPGMITEWRSPTSTLLRFSKSEKTATGRLVTIPSSRTHRYTRLTSRWSSMTATLTRPPGRAIPKERLQLPGAIGDIRLESTIHL